MCFFHILAVPMLTSILQCGEAESLSLEKFELLLTAHQEYIVSRLTTYFDPVLQELRDVAHVRRGVDVHPEQRDVNTQEPMKEVKKEVLFVPRASHVPSEDDEGPAPEGVREDGSESGPESALRPSRRLLRCRSNSGFRWLLFGELDSVTEL